MDSTGRTRNRIYAAIDLKSFYASVECRDRGLDPLKTNLLVADVSRTNKTICLAVSPGLKSYGIGGRARLFEAAARINEVNRMRNPALFNELKLGEYKETVDQDSIGRVIGDELISSINTDVLSKRSDMLVDYIVAPPRMATYMKYSMRIYDIYLKYVSAQDVHIYSIDEVFIDVTDYLNTYKMTAKELTMAMIKDVLADTGITATAGIGSNIYLAKIAMDIMAKKMTADENGVRIAELDELSYRKNLWSHKPLTDFWRVGRGYMNKLNSVGIYTMGDIAACSIGEEADYYNEDLLFRLFGVNAELLIDHAWGYEPVTISDIKKYEPKSTSISSGQVLTRPYKYDEAAVIVREMADLLSMDLYRKGLVTDALVLTIGYDIENLDSKEKRSAYKGEITTDWYGRTVPKHSHGTINLSAFSNSNGLIIDKILELYDRIVNRDLSIRRFNIEAIHIKDDKELKDSTDCKQLTLFDMNIAGAPTMSDQELKHRSQEKSLQDAMLKIRQKYGSNAVLKGTSFKKGATTRERNNQIGGHRA